jgi:hypothetical protein
MSLYTAACAAIAPLRDPALPWVNDPFEAASEVVTKGHCPDDILSQFQMKATTESAITQIWGTGLAIASQPPLFLYLRVFCNPAFNPKAEVGIYPSQYWLLKRQHPSSQDCAVQYGQNVTF